MPNLNISQLVSKFSSGVTKTSTVPVANTAKVIANWSATSSKAGSSVQFSTKRGRNFIDQILHLNNNYKKESMFSNMNKTELSMKGVPIEKFSKPGGSSCWYKIDDKLYYSPPHADSQIHKYVDEIYKAAGVQEHNITTLGRIGKSKIVMFQPDSHGYRFIESAGNISDNPKLLYDGFGVDCLLGNTINQKSILIANGKPIRVNNGLIPYEMYNSDGRLITPQKMLTEFVDIAEYFNPNSPSFHLLKNMHREDLIPALGRVRRLKDTDILKGHTGDLCNYPMIEETLIQRRNYILETMNKIAKTPRNIGEDNYTYLKRIETLMPKLKTYTAPINDTLKCSLTKAEKEIIERNWEEYKRLKKLNISHNATDEMVNGSYIHNLPLDNLDSVLKTGLVSGQVELGKTKIMGSSVGGDWSSTQGMLDTFKVCKTEKIKDYFVLKNRSGYEQGFLPKSGNNNITIVLNPKTLKGPIEQSIRYHGNLANNNPTHYTIPFGVAPQTIEKIIVNNIPREKISKIKTLIKYQNLDIKLYNIDGTLL